jgi:hypothetical protein
MPHYWIVICPVEDLVHGDDRVRDQLWDRWYQARCVAIGFSPELGHTYDGAKPPEGWKYRGWAAARNCLKKIEVGDKIVPFPKSYRIGPVGTVTEVRVKDEQWDPTIAVEESSSGRSRYGRRILVAWETEGMPPNGRLATVPSDPRKPHARLALKTIEELSTERFKHLCEVLANPSNWTRV